MSMLCFGLPITLCGRLANSEYIELEFVDLTQRQTVRVWFESHGDIDSKPFFMEFVNMI